jgi:hypothetical protein
LLLLHASGEVATVWAFNFFFYNKRLKRILYIGVKALSKAAAGDEDKVGGLGAVLCVLCGSPQSKHPLRVPTVLSRCCWFRPTDCLLLHTQDEDDSKCLYNSDDDDEASADYGMANTMDV